MLLHYFFFSSRRRHTRSLCEWSSDVCSSDLPAIGAQSLQMPTISAVGGNRGGNGGHLQRLRTDYGVCTILPSPPQSVRNRCKCPPFPPLFPPTAARRKCH